MSPFAFLWAQGVDDLIGILIVILFIIIPAIGQLVAKLRGAKPQQPQGGAQPDRPRPIRRQAQEVEDEIGEFLRRAARRHGGKPGEPAEAPRPAAKPVMAEAVKPPPRTTEAKAEHFARERFAKQVSQLGQQVAEEKKQMAKHPHDVFDHDVGQLSASTKRRERPAIPARSATAAGQTPSIAVGVAAMLTNTENIRQAIVLNEVLQRPEHRWS